MTFIQGLLVRSTVFVLGVVPLMVLLHAADVAADVVAMSVVVYDFVGSSFLAHYCVKHADEIPTRSARR